MSASAVFASPVEAVEQLQTTAALEAFSPLRGRGAFAIDLSRAGGSVSDAQLDTAVRTLAQLPCPSLGVGLMSATPLGRAVAGHLDVSLSDRAEADQLLGSIDRNPLAAAALVQQDDAVMGRVVKPAHGRIRPAARSAMDHQHGRAFGIAAFLKIDFVDVGDLEPAPVKRRDLGIEAGPVPSHRACLRAPEPAPSTAVQAGS